MSRLSFQSKLMLAVLAAVVLVTGVVISQTENKVRATYSRLAEAQFDEQAERFLELRLARLDAIANSVERLAAAPLLREVLEAGEFDSESLERVERLARNRTLPQTFRNRPAGDGGESAPAGEGGSDAEDDEENGEALPAGSTAARRPADHVVLLVDLDGRVHPVSRRGFTAPDPDRSPLRGLSVAEDLTTRQVGYLVLEGGANGVAESAGSLRESSSGSAERENGAGEPALVEVIVAPVKGSDGESTVGALVMGQVVNLSEVERFGSRGPDGGEGKPETGKGDEPGDAVGKGRGGGEVRVAAGSGSGSGSGPGAGGGPGIGDGRGKFGRQGETAFSTRRRLFSGIYADGRLFQGTLPDEAAEQVDNLLREQASQVALAASSSLEAAQLSREIVIERDRRESPDSASDADPEAVETQHYRLFCERLNPGGVLPPAYQVVLVPMGQLYTDLRDLRLRGSGVGGGAALMGLVLAWIFSRRLSRPIRELARATERVRKGDFHVRVPVRSKDDLGHLAESFNEMAGELETKEQIRDLLGKVSDEAVAQALISGRLELGGETREASILFCDIRGFTSLTESMSPSDVIGLLNEHMTALTEVVYAHHGVIDKFVGDEIMVIFGAPKRYGNDAANAARCALQMVERRRQLNQQTGAAIEVGIGIATGDVVVGCMGSTDRLNYTVIGERVNRAARLCGEAGSGEVVVDDSTWDRIADRAEGSERTRIRPKGYASDIRAFRLDAMRNDAGVEESEVESSAELAE